MQISSSVALRLIFAVTAYVGRVDKPSLSELTIDVDESSLSLFFLRSTDN